MNIHLTDRSGEAKGSEKEYLTEKLHKLDKMHLKIEDAHAILVVEKYRHIVEVTLTGKNIRIVAEEEDRDIIVAIDRVIQRLNHQLLKKKEMLKNKKGSDSRRFTEELQEQEPTEDLG